MIGIFGGTFDPVHFGHLRPALEILEGLGLSELRLVPSRIPPHRPAPGAGPDARLRMLELAAGDTPGFLIDRRELSRDGPSYTVDTLRSLRAELGEQTPLCLILGVDAFASLHEWREWEALPTLAHLVVMGRPGWDGPRDGPPARVFRERAVKDPDSLAGRAAGGVLAWPVTQLEISATEIRGAIAAGRSARYLLPEAVNDHILAQGLYGAGGGTQ